MLDTISMAAQLNMKSMSFTMKEEEYGYTNFTGSDLSREDSVKNP